jgi:hypothetical protein
MSEFYSDIIDLLVEKIETLIARSKKTDPQNQEYIGIIYNGAEININSYEFLHAYMEWIKNLKGNESIEEIIYKETLKAIPLFARMNEEKIKRLISLSDCRNEEIFKKTFSSIFKKSQIQAIVNNVDKIIRLYCLFETANNIKKDTHNINKIRLNLYKNNN